MPAEFTDAELEAGAEALYESAKGKLRSWEQYVNLGPPGADFYRGKVAVVLDAVVPLITARVRAVVAEEIAQRLLSVAGSTGGLWAAVIARDVGTRMESAKTGQEG